MREKRRPTTADKVAFLARADTHADGPRRVRVIETHFAWVFLTRRLAYKLKKPLRHGRMDYRTLARRRAGCLAELALNRRLAAPVYLDVVPLSTDRSGKLQLGPGARTEDWLVKMRRLPASGQLDNRIRQKRITQAQIRRLAATLTRFLRRAPRHPQTARAFVGRLRGEIQANRRALRALGHLPRERIDRVVREQQRWLRTGRAGIAARAARVVEGHGDLRPEHVYLGPPLAIIDRIEFDRSLRLQDPLEELAFLALEIERLGRPDLALQLIDHYRSSADREASDALLHFYMSHKALTRARLAAWHVGDPQFPDPRPWVARARSYLGDALRHIARAQVSLAASDRATAQAAGRRRSLPAPARTAGRQAAR